MGYGTAGSWLMVFKRPTTPFYPAFLFALTIPPLFWLSNRLPFDPALLPLDSFQWFYLVALFVLLALPFFFTGLTINLLLRKYPAESFGLYCFDLVGAAGGCLGFFLIAPLWKESEWLGVISLIGATSAWLLAEKRRQYLSVFILVGGVLGFWLGYGLPELKISPYKSLPLALRYPQSRILQTQWDATSRVDWFASPMARFAPGLSLAYRGGLPEQTGITVDGDLLTAFSGWEIEESDYLHYLPSRIVHELMPHPERILVLKVLGGHDVQAAAASGPAVVHAQTESALLADWLEKQNLPSNIVFSAEKVRTFLARSTERYDGIVVSLEGALPTGGSGMNVLQESSLETVEGTAELLRHLSPQGWLTFHRYLLPPPRAELRLIATLTAAMTRLGWEPTRHLGVFRSISTIMILVSSQEWSETHKDVFRRFCDKLGYAPVYYPGMRLDEANRTNRFARPIYAVAVRRLLTDAEAFHRQSIFDLKPVSDDRPFFYHFLRFKHLLRIYRSFGRKWEALIEAGMLLPAIFVLVFAIAVVCIGMPLLFSRNTYSLLSLGTSYFFWIGLGFMGMEIVLFEKLQLFLGDPTYSFALVLSSLLVASGIGSGLGRRLPDGILKYGHVGLLVLLGAYAVGFAEVLKTFSGSPFRVRLGIGLVSAGVPGILMGIPFPRGIVRISKNDELRSDTRREASRIEDRVALAWCFNGFASVVGSIGAMLLAQLSGFASLFLWSCFAYGMALLAYRRL